MHRALFMVAEAHGQVLDEVEIALARIEEQQGVLPDRARDLARSISGFLADYCPPGLRDKWDEERPG